MERMQSLTKDTSVGNDSGLEENQILFGTKKYSKRCQMPIMYTHTDVQLI